MSSNAYDRGLLLSFSFPTSTSMYNVKSNTVISILLYTYTFWFKFTTYLYLLTEVYTRIWYTICKVSILFCSYHSFSNYACNHIMHCIVSCFDLFCWNEKAEIKPNKQTNYTGCPRKSGTVDFQYFTKQKCNVF